MVVSTQKSKRMRQLAEDIREFVSTNIVNGNVSNPHVSRVTIHNVKVSPDLQVARINYTLPKEVVDSADLRKKVDTALKSVSVYLRFQLSKNLKIRYVPKLIFHFDENFEVAAHTLSLINQVSLERIEQ